MFHVWTDLTIRNAAIVGMAAPVEDEPLGKVRGTRMRLIADRIASLRLGPFFDKIRDEYGVASGRGSDGCRGRVGAGNFGAWRVIVVLFRGFERDFCRIFDAKGRIRCCTEQAGMVVGRSGRLAESDGEQTVRDGNDMNEV